MAEEDIDDDNYLSSSGEDYEEGDSDGEDGWDGEDTADRGGKGSYDDDLPAIGEEDEDAISDPQAEKRRRGGGGDGGIGSSRQEGGGTLVEEGYKLSEREERRLIGAFLISRGAIRDEVAPGERREYYLSPSRSNDCFREFCTILISLGVKLREADMRLDFQQLVKEAQAREPDDPRLTLDTLRRYYVSKMQGKHQEEKIRMAWEGLWGATGEKSSDGGQPYIDTVEYQHIFANIGEPLNDEEMGEMLGECRPDAEGRIFYDGYRRMLLERA